MKQSIKLLLLIIIAISLISATRYLNNEGDGVPVYPQVVEAVPSAPYVCAVAQRGKQIYVDDTNDTAESYLCFCGVDADDATYIWLKTQDPAVDCF